MGLQCVDAPSNGIQGVSLARQLALDDEVEQPLEVLRGFLDELDAKRHERAADLRVFAALSFASSLRSTSSADIAASLPGATEGAKATGDKFRLVLTLANSAAHSRFHEFRQRLAFAEQLLDLFAQFRFNPNRRDGRGLHAALNRVCATRAERCKNRRPPTPEPPTPPATQSSPAAPPDHHASPDAP